MLFKGGDKEQLNILVSGTVVKSSHLVTYIIILLSFDHGEIKLYFLHSFTV